jgi:outer membrane protein OmpA-like peptidoglycan-associated protein
MLTLINEKDVTPVMKKFYGQAYKTLPGDLPPGMQVELVNDKGEVVMIATVDEKGNFVFDKLPSDKFFNIRIKDINDSGIQMIALNESGEKLADVKKDAKGGFVYERLAPDQMFLTMFDAKDQPVLVKASATRFNFGIIHYEYDRSDLGNNAKQELNKLIKVLKENKNVMVQLTAYTDSKGSDEYNNLLSERRAKAAYGYIVSKGINSARIKYLGKGEQNPIAPNEHPNGEDNPEGRAKNRRTEIVLMGN